MDKSHKWTQKWTLDELQTLHDMPLLELISKAHLVHAAHHQPGVIQACHLISIKTGGCPEDCKYCPQSSHYQTGVSAQPLMQYDEVIDLAKKAMARGVTRICMGAAWRQVRDGKQFDAILRMIQGVADLGVEVCCTLGLLEEHQAKRLKEAGLYAYNHNLDSSEKFYKTIITTRTYQERLKTLDIVQKEGLSVCCGGIIGMGEDIADRLELIQNLCNRSSHPESVPINRLTQVPGTPLEDQPRVSLWETVRMIAVARITMPKSMVRFSCGRYDLSYVEQALCFLAGANSIFIGEKMFTTINTQADADDEMIKLLGITKRKPYSMREGS